MMSEMIIDTTACHGARPFICNSNAINHESASSVSMMLKTSTARIFCSGERALCGTRRPCRSTAAGSTSHWPQRVQYASAFWLSAPQCGQNIRVLPLALALKHILQHEPDVRGSLRQAAHEIGIPGLAVRDIDAHAVAVAHELLLQVAAHAIEHLELE